LADAYVFGGSAGWTSETCKCAYDPTDNHKVDAFRLLAGCVIMLFAQVRQHDVTAPV
jgi:hypothetical protein